jgi:lysylphosphatidylglycerol synthetase-like protein (DUF2156 family)
MKERKIRSKIILNFILFYFIFGSLKKHTRDKEEEEEEEEEEEAAAHIRTRVANAS